MDSPKKRNRGAVYPYEFVARLTQDMGDQLDAVIVSDPTRTKAAIVRQALKDYLHKIQKGKGK